MLLVEAHELEEGILAVLLRRHLVFLDAVDEEPVVRGHAPERSHEDLRDETGDTEEATARPATSLRIGRKCLAMYLCSFSRLS